MSAQHTPGPWITVEVGEYVSALAVSDENGVSLLTVVDEEGVKFGAVYNEADADLIAAAPDMLAALIVAREFISTDRTALADCSIDHEGRMSDDDAAAVADYDKALLQIDAAIQKATGGAA